MTVSVIVPVFNEAATLIALTNAIMVNMAEYNVELVIVDDGSTDTTKGLVQQMKNNHVTLICFDKNYGQSAAIIAGIENSKGDLIVLLDGDLQNDPSDIPKLINSINAQNVDLVQGVRENRQDSWLKIVPSKIANTIIRLLFQVPLHDVGCSIKVFKKEVVLHPFYFNGFHRFIPLIAYLKGYRVIENAVNHQNRTAGYSKYGLSRTSTVIKHLFELKFPFFSKHTKPAFKIISIENFAER